MDSGEVIWKYPLPFNEADDSGRHHVTMPVVSHYLTVQVQHEVPALWVQVDPKSQTVTKTFEWQGTGGTVPYGGKYIGTVQVQGGAYVFHLYEVGA